MILHRPLWLLLMLATLAQSQTEAPWARLSGQFMPLGHRTRSLKQTDPPDSFAQSCFLTDPRAFNQPRSTWIFGQNRTACFSINFKAELVDVYVNRLTNETRRIPYLYSGTLVDGLDTTSCESLTNNATDLLVRFFYVWDSDPTGPTTWPTWTAWPFWNRPYLPFDSSVFCRDTDWRCYGNSTACQPGSPWSCPVKCGTCDKEWQLQYMTLGKVYNANVASCCDMSRLCRLSQTMVSEVFQEPSPDAALYLPGPPPPAAPAALPEGTTLTCPVTAWEALMPVKSIYAYYADDFKSCVSVKASFTFEETFTELSTNKTIKNTFNRQGLVTFGNDRTCANQLSATEILSAWVNRTFFNGTINYETNLIKDYELRSDGIFKTSEVCQDTDLGCFTEPQQACQSYADLCPVTCNLCQRTQLGVRKYRLNSVKLISSSASPGQCCDTTNLCTEYQSVLGRPLSELVPPGGNSTSSPPGSRDLPSLVPTTPAPASSTTTSDSSSSSKTGLIAGVAAGVGGAVLLALLLLSICLCRRKHSAAAAAARAPTSKFQLADFTTMTPKAMDMGVKAIEIQGLDKTGQFCWGTAPAYTWSALSASAANLIPVEAGVNDVQLDMTAQGPPGGAHCPVVQLSSAQVKEELHLFKDGLLGVGATAIAFKALWPSRFGPDAVLAVKVVKGDDEPKRKENQIASFMYEAQVLLHTSHPNVVKMYGYCLEGPTVCLIMEVLQCSVKDVLYSRPAAQNTALSQRTTDLASGLSDPPLSQTQVTSTSSAAFSTDDAVHITIPVAEPGVEGGAGDVAAPRAPPAAPTAELSLLQVLQMSTDIAAGLAYLHDVPITDISELPELASFRLGPLETVHTETTDSSTYQSTGDGGHKRSRIVHRDLKPANILLNSKGVAKISDFGLAREHDNTTLHTERVGAGTLPYMAPELLKARANHFKDDITNKVDIYSMAMIIYELLAREAPWRGMHEMVILNAVTSGQRPRLPPVVSSSGIPPKEERLTRAALAQTPATLEACPELVALIRACWNKRDFKRPTAAELHAKLYQMLHYTATQASTTAS